MTKAEYIECLKEFHTGHSLSELKKLTKDELQELYEEFADNSLTHPNGRDEDAEDEDGI